MRRTSGRAEGTGDWSTGRRVGGLGAVGGGGAFGPEVEDYCGAELFFVDVAGGAAVVGAAREVGGLVGGEQQHGGVGVGVGDAAGGLDAVDARQVDVHQHQARRERLDELHRLLARFGLA